MQISRWKLERTGSGDTIRDNQYSGRCIRGKFNDSGSNTESWRQLVGLNTTLECRGVKRERKRKNGGELERGEGSIPSDNISLPFLFRSFPYLGRA